MILHLLKTVLYLTVNEEPELCVISVGQVSHTALANVEVWEWIVGSLLSPRELAAIFNIKYAKQHRTPTGIYTVLLRLVDRSYKLS